MDPLVPLSIFIAQISNESKNSLILKIAIIIVCVVLGGIFAAAETAVSKCNLYRIQAKADDGKKKAKVLLMIKQKEDNFIINILICINIVHILSAIVATSLFASLIADDNIAALISTIVITIIVFLFSESLPKFIASKKPDIVAENLSILLYLLGIILTPIAIVFRLLVKAIKMIFKVNDDEQKITGEDFQDTIEDNEEVGNLDSDEGEIIKAAIDFGDYTVMQVLTPVEKMVVYNANPSSRRDLIAFSRTVEYTRIPVYEESVNNIIGILHIRKYLLATKDNRNYFNLKSILTKPLFVDENTNIDDMFDMFQENRNHIAIVKNSKTGVVLGMVTMEDVVEKLVGEIDEKNPPRVKFGGKR